MDRLRTLFAADWFSVLLLGVALALGLLLVRARRRRHETSFPLLLSSAGLALFGVGGLVAAALYVWDTVDSPAQWSGGVASLALGALLVSFVVLLASGRWSASLAFVLLGLSVAGAGGWAGRFLTRQLDHAILLLFRLEVVQPFWLMLLLFIPLLIWYSYRSLAGLGPVRRWLALGLRCALILLLTLALAEIRLRHANENVTVLFLVDRSLSIPEEHDLTVDPKSPQALIDQRWERLRQFINDSVEKRGIGHDRDRAGLIVFGKRPRLELPPSAVPRFNLREITSPVDSNYTDIAAAIKLALASFPEDTAKRIVLMSDGNENLGNAEEQARIAHQNGVPIDVIPLATGQRNENEILVQGVEAPTLTDQNAQLPIRVLVRSYNPNRVQGILKLWQVIGGQRTQVPGPPEDRVELRPGLNSFTFKHRLTGQQKSYTYEAIFEPERVVNDKNELLQAGLPGDRAQNNRATTHVIALGRRKILLIEPKRGDHAFLVERLTKAKDAKFRVHTAIPDDLPQNKTELAVFLSDYDCVILANVPASDVEPGNVGAVVPGTITEEQQEVIRANTADQGCGLIMIGGPYSFGAGGWQGTPVEKALPVDCDIKSVKIEGKGGLVLIMHACEMANGNSWEKQIAKLALKKLSQSDEFGVIQWNFATTWPIDLQQIGENRNRLLRKVDGITPNDMPDFDPALTKAHDALVEPRRALATKHIIVISDGDPASTPAVLKRLKDSKVTVTTVGVATHGAPMAQALANIARSTGGRFYNVLSPNALPAIYTKESRLITQSFVYEKRFLPKFTPQAGGPTDGLPANLEPLLGFVRTTPKQSNLYYGPILGPSTADQEFPVLAYWQYGLGKSAAFTSDARKAWDVKWAESAYYDKFWEQLVGWAVRSVESGRLSMTTEFRDGKIKVLIDARDRDGKMLTDLTIQGGITTPGGDGAAPAVKIFEQKNSGMYEAEFKAEEAGSYFINASASRKVKKMVNGKEVISEERDGIRAGVTLPYSPEFADMESNTTLLEKLREITSGRTIDEDADSLKEAASGAVVFRHTDLPESRSLQPIWYWLLMLTGTLLLFDVAVRRIALDPLVVTAAIQRQWERLRRRTAPADTTAQFLDRLKSRKEQVDEALGKARAQQRFVETTDAPSSSAPPPGADEAAAPKTPTAGSAPKPPSVAPDKETKKDDAGDFASRLMRAKKRVWEEREKDKDKDKET